jgi:hypothetical protein
MNETQLQALLSHIDTKIALAVAQSKGHIKPVDVKLHEDAESSFQILWNSMDFNK